MEGGRLGFLTLFHPFKDDKPQVKPCAHQRRMIHYYFKIKFSLSFIKFGKFSKGFRPIVYFHGNAIDFLGSSVLYLGSICCPNKIETNFYRYKKGGKVQWSFEYIGPQILHKL